jgi:uncharacterized RDD family membrane protein YckC
MECPNCGHHVRAHSQRCGSCGKIIPPGQHLLEESGVVEPFIRPVTGSAGAHRELRAASLGDRMIATMLDSIILLGGSAVVSAWCFLRWGFTSGGEVQLTAASLLVAGTLSALTVFAYLWLLEAAFGATLGKVLVGIRVVRTSSRTPLTSSAIRNALRIIDGIGFYLVGATVAECSRLHRRLGDIVAGTAVVEEQFSAGPKLLAVVLWMAMLGSSVWILPRVCAREISTQPPPYLGRSVVQLSHKEDSMYLCIARLRFAVQLAPAAPREGVASVDSSPRQ